MTDLWPPLIFAAVVLLALAVVLYGTWPTEREHRLSLAAEEITAAEAKRNAAELIARHARELLTPDQVALLDERLARSDPGSHFDLEHTHD